MDWVSNTSQRSDCICSSTSWVSIRSQGITANTIELMVLVHRTVVCGIIRDIRYVTIRDYGI